MRCLNHLLEDFYARYAYVVYRHAWLFIVLPLASTLCFSVGFLLLNDRMINDTYYLFTPYDGKSRREKAVVFEHWPMDENSFVPNLSPGARHFLFINVLPKNKSRGLWNNETLDEIWQLNDYIMNNYTLTTADGSSTFSYSDICMTYKSVCFGNPHILALRAQSILLENGGSKMTYPITREFLTDDASFIGFMVGNVTLNETDGKTLLAVGALRLAYFGKDTPIEIDTMSIQWRIGILEYLLGYKSDLIDLTFANDDSVAQGLIENSNYYAPQIAVTFTLMLAFTFLNSFVVIQRQGFVGVDWVRSKPLLAIFGVSEPGLAITSTVGLLLLIGMPYYPVLVAMPFLVFAIGVDDMFIMMSAWHGTKKTDPPEVRFSQTLSEAAVSVTITSVSDILAFAVGSWNSLPGVQLFCIYTSVAFFFELVYQCTFYAAAVALFAKAECEGKHCITLKKTISVEEAKTTRQRRLMAGTIVSQPQAGQQQSHIGQPDSSHTAAPRKSFSHERPDMNFVQKMFHKYYVPILLRPASKFLALLLFLIYLGFSGWGCAIMGNGIQPEKLMLKGHYSIDFLQSEYIWDSGCGLQVVVSNPANVTTTEGRNKMLQVVAAFEDTKHSASAAGTLCWLREFMHYLNTSRQLPIEDTQAQWCGTLNEWLLIDTSGQWVKSIQWGNESEGRGCDIVAFRFIVTTTHFLYPVEAMDAAVMFRSIADDNSEYNVSIFEEFNLPFADQFLMVTPTMVRNGILAIVTMILLSMLMIPHPICGIFITLSTVSIDTGVSGFLAWWGVNMDGLSMMTMIMATGFAVDLSAHVSYAYIRSPGSPEDRVRQALEELGWPVFQGVTSTLLGVLVLGTIDNYMFQTFFKTVFLVIIFGILHSLVFLPIALTVFAPGKINFNKCRRKSRTADTKAVPTNLDSLDHGKNGHRLNGQQHAALEIRPEASVVEETLRPRKNQR